MLNNQRLHNSGCRFVFHQKRPTAKQPGSSQINDFVSRLFFTGIHKSYARLNRKITSVQPEASLIYFKKYFNLNLIYRIFCQVNLQYLRVCFCTYFFFVSPAVCLNRCIIFDKPLKEFKHHFIFIFTLFSLSIAPTTTF